MALGDDDITLLIFEQSRSALLGHFPPKTFAYISLVMQRKCPSGISNIFHTDLDFQSRSQRHGCFWTQCVNHGRI